jgi:hypothetical protein
VGRLAPDEIGLTPAKAVTPPDAVFFAENIIFPAGEIPFHYSPRPPEYVREYAAQIRK